jgi:hypothetical protein
MYTHAQANAGKTERKEKDSKVKECRASPVMIIDVLPSVNAKPYLDRRKYAEGTMSIPVG